MMHMVLRGQSRVLSLGRVDSERAPALEDNIWVEDLFLSPTAWDLWTNHLAFLSLSDF